MKGTIPISDLSKLLVSREGRQFKSVLGYEFNSSDNMWKLSKDNTLNFGLVMSRTPATYHVAVRGLLEHYATTFSAGTVLAVAGSLGKLFMSGIEELNENQLINFKSASDGSYAHLQCLRPFFRRWLIFGYPGVSKTLVDMLDSWRLPGAAKGEAVKRLDPKQGPLSDFELASFNEGVVFSYEHGSMTLYDLALSLVISCTGRRPLQITHLKCKDVLVVPNADGSNSYYLHIPRAKQEGANFRDEFKTIQLTRDLWEILESHKKDMWQRLVSLGYSLTQSHEGLLPLFPAPKKWLSYESESAFVCALPGESMHVRTENLDLLMKGVVSKLGMTSDRTDGALHLFAKRFRYTLGTRAAREGLSKYVIAELLDHSDTQHVDVYTLNVPEHLKKIDAALGYQLARYAQAFTGNLVDSELDALRGADPSSRIKHRKCGVGTCGSFSYCGMNVPRPCYTCASFQPWLDGPHEMLYFELIDEREKLLAGTSDLTIAAVLDRTIVAVAQVIERCNARKEEAADG